MDITVLLLFLTLDFALVAEFLAIEAGRRGAMAATFLAAEAAVVVMLVVTWHLTVKAGMLFAAGYGVGILFALVSLLLLVVRLVRFGSERSDRVIEVVSVLWLFTGIASVLLVLFAFVSGAIGAIQSLFV